MSGYKRGWLPFWISGSAFYAFTLFGGIMTIRSVILHPSGDNVSPIVFALFMIILGHMMLAGVIISIFYLKGKKTAFISAFMEAEPMWSRFKLEYNRDWLETYEDKLEHLK